jgi:hypothetical protein
MTPNPLPLAVVDSQTGELRAAGCSECAELAAKLAGREADLEALTEEFTRLLRKRDALLRDRERERELDPQRLVILEVWDYYREKCRHPNSKLDAHRFDLVKARLRQFTAAELKAAIDGAAVAAYVDADGKRHDRIGLIFQSAERVEDFANRWHRWQRAQGSAR